MPFAGLTVTADRDGKVYNNYFIPNQICSCFVTIVENKVWGAETLLHLKIQIYAIIFFFQIIVTKYFHASNDTINQQLLTYWDKQKYVKIIEAMTKHIMYFMYYFCTNSKIKCRFVYIYGCNQLSSEFHRVTSIDFT